MARQGGRAVGWGVAGGGGRNRRRARRMGARECVLHAKGRPFALLLTWPPVPPPSHPPFATPLAADSPTSAHRRPRAAGRCGRRLRGSRGGGAQAACHMAPPRTTAVVAGHRNTPQRLGAPRAPPPRPCLPQPNHRTRQRARQLQARRRRPPHTPRKNARNNARPPRRTVVRRRHSVDARPLADLP